MLTPQGVPVPLAHIFFVHSPITYTVAVGAIRMQGIARPVLMGARGIAGPDIAEMVDEDGLWSIPDVCKVLERMIRHVPDGAKIALYLPHTAFLLGKLVRCSGRVARIYYLEEGLTSVGVTVGQAYYQPVPFDVEELLASLRVRGLLDSWGLSEDDVRGMDKSELRPFDTNNRRYAGSFACSQDAFAALPGVRRMALAADPVDKPVCLLSIAGLRNGMDEPQQLEWAFRRVLSLCVTMIGKLPPGHILLVKLHPRDVLLQPDWFRSDVARLQVDYFAYCAARGINANLEPAMLNFAHYFFVGTTSQSKYVEQLLGADRMTLLDVSVSVTK